MILKYRSRGWAGVGAEPSAALGACWCGAASSPCSALLGGPGGRRHLEGLLRAAEWPSLRLS